MFLTQRVHPYPFRTRKLSFAVPKILDWRRSGKIGQRRHKSRRSGESVILTQRVHPYPFRTRKLSFAVPKILDWRRSGKIGHSRHQRDMLDRKCIPYFIFLLSSVGSANISLCTHELVWETHKFGTDFCAVPPHSSLAQLVVRTEMFTPNDFA